MIRLLWILLVVSLVPSGLIAADSIYTWGYGEQAHNVLKSVSMMTAGGGDYTLRFAAALGLFVFAFKIMVMGKDNTLQEITKYLLIVTVVGYMFWISKKEYIVEDQVDLYTSPAALNLPVGVGTTLSIFSGIEKAFGEGMEKYFSTPTSIGIMKQGLGFQMNVHLNTAGAGIQDSYVIRSYNEYISNCLLPAIDSGVIDSNVISTSDDLKNDLKVNNSLLTNVYKVGAAPELLECNLAWPKISAGVTSDYASILTTIGSVTPGGMNASFATDIGTVFRTMYGDASNTAQAGILQAALRNGLSDGLESAALAIGGDASNLALSKAMTDQSLKSGWSQAGIAAQKTLPLQKAVFTLVLMGLIVFLALMSIIFVTMQYVKTIFMLFAVLVMWNPIAAIINYLISLQMDKVTTQILAATGGAKYPSYMTVNVISANAADYMAFLGFFGTLIPMFAYLLVKGGDSIASHMYSSIAGGMSMAARSGSALQALGNAQTGNVSAGNRQFANESTGSKSEFIRMGDGGLLSNSISAEGFKSSRIDQSGQQIEKRSSSESTSPFETTVTQGNTSTSSMGGNIQTAKFTSLSDASSGNALTKVQEKTIAENDQKTQQYRVAEMQAFANAIEDTQGRSEKISVLRSMGLTEKDADTILTGIETSKGANSNLTYGNGANAGHVNGTTTSVNASASVEGGATAKKGQDKDKKADGSVGATGGVTGAVNKSETTNTGDSSNISAGAGENSSYARKGSSSISNVIENNKALQKALDRAATATHVDKSTKSDSHVKEASNALAHSLTVGEALRNSQTDSGASGRNLMVPAINDYAERMGFVDQNGAINQEALTGKLKDLDTIYSKGGKDDEWEKSLKNVIMKTSGINPEASNVDEVKLTKGANAVEADVDSIPEHVADKFHKINGSHLNPSVIGEYEGIFSKEARNNKKPGVAPRVTEEQGGIITEVNRDVKSQQGAAIVNHANNTSINDLPWYETATMSTVGFFFPDDVEKLKHNGAPTAENFNQGTGAFAPQTKISELTQNTQDKMIDAAAAEVNDLYNSAMKKLKGF